MTYVYILFVDTNNAGVFLSEEAAIAAAQQQTEDDVTVERWVADQLYDDATTEIIYPA